MRLSHVAVVLGVSVLAFSAGSLLNFKLMIQWVTQKNALIYFNGYGCYCGKGGRGKPRDRTDMCCYKHDCCYEDLHHEGCHPFIDHYRYLIINNNVLCKYKNGSLCATLACECDKHASLCFKHEASSYSLKLRHYPAVLCKELTPKCFPSPKS
ncbi:basic phospholipase A2 PLA-B-like [Candoia aspera]|uniref:basic phospholipase A2 PLA-B-like n=1 Tax=Candoia aspera TaxID=51853 RepID=UPI002FD86102